MAVLLKFIPSFDSVVSIILGKLHPNSTAIPAEISVESSNQTLTPQMENGYCNRNPQNSE